MLYDKKWDKIEVAPVEQWRLDLLKAADLIEQRGHARWMLEDCEGKLCIGGAINFVVTGQADWLMSNNGLLYYNMPDRVCIMRSRLHCACGGDLVNWNNHRDRTKAEVVAKLREVASS
jgi:hypothetical protein